MIRTTAEKIITQLRYYVKILTTTTIKLVPYKHLPVETFQHEVLYWYDTHGRKSLPWQHNKTPYRVWLAEVMLQQTQVATVLPYYARFLQAFPDLAALAQATEEAVLHLWTGLGYYSRARNLHKAARLVYFTRQNRFPDNINDLQLLPGVGRSTAGAIVACAFDQQAAILDGNVKRFLTRLHGITTWPGEAQTHAELWRLAELYTPPTRCAEYTQAMMDIGATLCVRGKPLCARCPFRKDCRAHALGIQNLLPHKKPKKVLPVRTATLIIVRSGNEILLEKRPPSGVWGSLWSLPEIAGHPSATEITAFCRDLLRQAVTKVVYQPAFRHTFSHYHFDIQPVIATIIRKTHKIMAAESQIWYDLVQPSAIGMPAPIKSLLQRLSEEPPPCHV